MLTKDRSLAVFVLVFVAILLIESSNIPDKTAWQPYGSSLFPRILLSILAILSVALLLKSILKSDISPQFIAPLTETLRKKWKVIALFIIFGLYAISLPLLGYLVSTLAFMLASQILLLGINSRKKIIIIFSTSFTIAPLIYVIFQLGLNIWLP